jgi:hypothetical protein
MSGGGKVIAKGRPRPSILAIDPGPTHSAYVWWEGGKPMSFAKTENSELRAILKTSEPSEITAIEMIASYGMAVGREIFETAVWIGRFQECCANPSDVQLIFRKDVKLYWCGTTKAKDANIRQALLDHFGPQGTKKAPGILYGVKADVWSAVAIAAMLAFMNR